jgi:hypothetical protein
MSKKLPWLAAGLVLLAGSGQEVLRADASQNAPTVPQGRQLSPPWYNFSPSVEPDVVTQDLGAIGEQPFVDIHAWNLFVAVNWPAGAGARGVPNRANVIGGVPKSPEGGGEQPNGPTVWETYKDTDDIYLNPPVRPAPFDAPEIIPPACRLLAKADPLAAGRTLTMKAKASDVLRDFRQAGSLQPLVDQNGALVWYEVKVNRVYYDFVVDHGYYDSRRQPAQVRFPSAGNATRGEGTVEVKAAWKVLGELGSKQPDDPARFYTTTALIYDADANTCKRQRVGLVGLHIKHKTDTFKQWIWATFEHVDNAPTQGQTLPPGARFSFNNPSCTSCPVNQPPPNLATPVQVVRVTPIDENAATQNTLFRKALAALRPGNVWQYYELVNAQWRLTDDGAPRPAPSASPSPAPPPTPPFLANTTLETYLQGPSGPTGPPHGCLNCHAIASQKDFDFQLFKAYPHSKATFARLLAQLRAGAHP